MRYIEQLNLWVDGISTHDDEHGQCCPDFSCCNKDVDTPEGVKHLFRDAYLRNNEETINRLLIGFLGIALKSLPGKEVYIAGSHD